MRSSFRAATQDFLARPHARARGRRMLLAASRSRREVETEVNQSLLRPIDHAQVYIGCYQPYFVAYPVCDDRGLGIIQNDAIFLIEPARRDVHFRDDGIEAERRYAIGQHAVRTVERLALRSE